MMPRAPYQSLPTAPVDSLVDDTLRVIFEHCSLTRRRDSSIVLDEPSGWTDRVSFFEPTEVFKICLVSPRWNRVARDHAVLWTHIHVERNQLAQLQFKLSRNAPLQIMYGGASDVCRHSSPIMASISGKTVDDIEANMHRVELLSFSVSLTKLEHLVSVYSLIPVLFSTPAPQLKCWHMCFHGSGSQDPGKFDELLASPFHDHVLGVRNIHWQNYRPIEPHRFLKGLSSLVFWDLTEYSRREIELLSIFRSNPSLEELDIPSFCKLGPINGTHLAMECLTLLHLAHIYHDHLETLLHKVSLPVIQDLELGIYPNEQFLPISLRDTFLAYPALRNLFSIPQSLSFNTGGFLAPNCVHLHVHTAHRVTMPEVCVLVNKAPLSDDAADLFRHFLEMFPNVNSLYKGPGYLFTAVNMGTSPGINTVELIRPRGEHLKTLNA
ncbi:MAG TPA: hypothetical protein VGO47_03155, partial [Chlamydiales bacterium]|nr:hypothetical protein [Chlamydiales bacterium]